MDRTPRPITFFKTFNDKIDEYYSFSMRSRWGADALTAKVLATFPLCRFVIHDILTSLVNKGRTPEQIEEIGCKLIDIKLAYCFRLIAQDRFYIGPALIVGNDEIEKLNPYTLSILQEDHYKVYLLSIMIEKSLDLMQLIHSGEAKDHKNDKWNKIIVSLPKEYKDRIIGTAASQMFSDFKDKYRTAEMHKSSMVRAFTAKNQWNHFQAEEKAVDEMLSRLYQYIVNDVLP
jgi:hypothetical protein